MCAFAHTQTRYYNGHRSVAFLFRKFINTSFALLIFLRPFCVPSVWTDRENTHTHARTLQQLTQISSKFYTEYSKKWKHKLELNAEGVTFSKIYLLCTVLINEPENFLNKTVSDTRGCTMDQADCGQPPTIQTHIQSQASLYRICGRKSNT